MEGTSEGFDAARARGQWLGRPAVMTPDKIRMAFELVGKESVAAIARLLGVNQATLYAHVPALQDRRRTALPLPGRIGTRSAASEAWSDAPPGLLVPLFLQGRATLLRPGERELSAERITEHGGASRPPARPETRTPALATAAAIHRRATERRQHHDYEQLNSARAQLAARAEFASNHPTTALAGPSAARPPARGHLERGDLPAGTPPVTSTSGRCSEAGDVTASDEHSAMAETCGGGSPSRPVFCATSACARRGAR